MNSKTIDLSAPEANISLLILVPSCLKTKNENTLEWATNNSEPYQGMILCAVLKCPLWLSSCPASVC